MLWFKQNASIHSVIVILAQCVWPVWTQVIHLTDMYGTIKSPNFPESYPKETELQWNISVPDGYQIRLYFMHFDIEPSYLCEYDYLKVSEYLQMFQSPFTSTSSCLIK